MSTDHTEQQIREFLTNNFIFDPTVQLDLEDSFMENGVVDSTGILEVIMWVESNFGVKVEDSEVLPENFDSIGSLMRYVESKQAGSEAKEEAETSEARNLALAS
jgi:acyl carrier protein